MDTFSTIFTINEGYDKRFLHLEPIDLSNVFLTTRLFEFADVDVS